MQLNLLSFSTLVQSSAASMQAACSRLLDLSIGSVLRAIIEASSAQALWLQFLVLRVLSAIRAATCVGADLDGWMADFSFLRLPGTPATGAVTFSRFAATNAALVSPGALVKSVDGVMKFIVYADTGNGAWNAGLNGYLVNPGTSAVTIPVVCSVLGAAGNVQVNTITLIASAIAGIDTVTNASAFTNALDAELDGAFRSRFAAYIASLAKATLAAIRFAISSVQQGLTFSIVENYDNVSVWTPGLLTVYVDDGSGAPSSPLLDRVRSAIEAFRGATIRYAVFGPSVLTANVALTAVTAAGYTHATVTAQVAAAISAAITATGMGVGFYYGSLFQIALNVAGVVSVSSVTLNSGTANLAGVAGQVIRPGTVAVS